MKRVPFALACFCTKGYLRPAETASAWCEKCPLCRGQGAISIASIARLAGINRQTMRRFVSGCSCRRITLVRVLDAALLLEASSRTGVPATRVGKMVRQGELFG